jgi:hypothetical protein
MAERIDLDPVLWTGSGGFFINRPPRSGIHNS